MNSYKSTTEMTNSKINYNAEYLYKKYKLTDVMKILSDLSFDNVHERFIIIYIVENVLSNYNILSHNYHGLKLKVLIKKLSSKKLPHLSGYLEKLIKMSSHESI